MMWKLDRYNNYFRIFDENKNIAGYFAPEYGDIFPEEKIDEVIEEMHNKHEKIKGGYLMIPMVKFNVFGLDKEMEIDYLIGRIEEVKDRIAWWQKFVLSLPNSYHKIRVSHTDPDMLSITFPIFFENPLPLEKNVLLEELKPTLDSLNSTGLL